MTQPLRILLIQSDPEISENLKTLLEQGGYELTVCSGAAEGIGLLKKAVCPLVLLDPACGEDDQMELLDFVHRFCPDSLVIPIAGFAAPRGDRADPGPTPEGGRDGRVGIKSIMMTIDRLSRSIQGRGREKERQAQALKMAKELQESNLRLIEVDRRKNSCLAVATHELRTPITIVNGYLKLLLGESFGGLNEKQKHLLQESQENCSRLITLVNSMLDRCRLESESVEYDYRHGAYLVSLRKVAGRMQDYIEESGLTLAMDLPKEEVFLDFDPDAIEQALVNLIGNAVKFTPPPGKITVRCRMEKEGVLTQVMDTGLGIEPEDIDKVFDEFNRVGKKHGEKKGAGLGLSICKKIVHAHHGDIWVESLLGKGSCFSFLLPEQATRPASR